MQTITKILFNEEEKVAIEKAIKWNLSLRDTAKVLGCSYEQVRILLWKLLKQGYKEGWITIDFNKI